MTDRICSLPDCGRRHVARGWCRNHYMAWKRTGSPVPVVRPYVRGRVCDFPDCGRPHDCRGLCRGHNAQKDSGKPLAALGEYRKSTDRDEQGRKRCRACDEWLTPGAFTTNRKTADGLSPVCGPCTRDSKMRITYGITLEVYLRMLEEQGGGCAICARRNPGGAELAVDHDHACCPGRKSCGACVRALLCSACNTGIGMFGEDPARLHAAAAYLRR